MRRIDVTSASRYARAIRSLAVIDANKVTHVAAEAHVRIIRAMDRHQDDERLQEKACGALRRLAHNDTNYVTLMAADESRR